MRNHHATTSSLRTGTTLGLAIVAIAAASCSSDPNEGAPEAGPNMSTAAEESEGWRLLFDGDDLEQWRGYRRDAPPASWQPQDSVLAFVTADDGGDLMTREQFGDFELRYEWRISEGGNSGVIYRVTEDSEQPWHTGPEMQVLDDERHPDARAGVSGNRTAGALYDMIPPTPGVVRPAGEWNEARIIARGNQVEHWMNGQKVLEFEVGSEEWNRLYQASKFRELPGFAVQPRGHIVLQDHGDPVWFRSVKIRSLDP